MNSQNLTKPLIKQGVSYQTSRSIYYLYRRDWNFFTKHVDECYLRDLFERIFKAERKIF